MSTRTISIRTAPAGYRIEVEPRPEWADMARERPGHRDALRYAESLKIVHGWRIVDETGGAR